MLHVIDTASSQSALDFGVAFREGFRDCYVKMGGDNVDTYVAPWYSRQVDRARAAGFEHVGHYWVPDGNLADPDPIDTPTQQADWMVDRLHDWRPATDFLVLDNEALDGGWMLTDAGAAEFIERFKARKGVPGRQCAMYGGWYDLAAHAWPAVLATGAMFIVADYRASSPPMGFPDLPTVPRSRIIGHQYGGRAIGGVITDVNAFVDGAFNYGPRPEEDDEMLEIITVDGKQYLTTATAMVWIEGPAHVAPLAKWVGGAQSLTAGERQVVEYYQVKLRAVLPTPTIDLDALALKLTGALRIPTAEENGAAARAAIVK